MFPFAMGNPMDGLWNNTLHASLKRHIDATSLMHSFNESHLPERAAFDRRRRHHMDLVWQSKFNQQNRRQKH
jgi:hypothetical protein